MGSTSTKTTEALDFEEKLFEKEYQFTLAYLNNMSRFRFNGGEFQNEWMIFTRYNSMPSFSFDHKGLLNKYLEDIYYLQIKLDSNKSLSNINFYNDCESNFYKSDEQDIAKEYMNHKYREILVDCVHNDKQNTKQFINQLIRLIAPKLSFSSKYCKNTIDSGEKCLSSLYLSNMNIKINEFEKILLSFSFLNAFQISDSYINGINRDIKLSHPDKHKDKQPRFLFSLLVINCNLNLSEFIHILKGVSRNSSLMRSLKDIHIPDTTDIEGVRKEMKKLKFSAKLNNI